MSLFWYVQPDAFPMQPPPLSLSFYFSLLSRVVSINILSESASVDGNECPHRVDRIAIVLLKKFRSLGLRQIELVDLISD